MEKLDQCPFCNCTDLDIINDKPYLYNECGLPVLLIGIDYVKCKRCKEEFAEIPAVEKLHRVIGLDICKSDNSPLTSSEIRFLRKEMGWDLSKAGEVLSDVYYEAFEKSAKMPPRIEQKLVDSFLQMVYNESEDVKCVTNKYKFELMRCKDVSFEFDRCIYIHDIESRVSIFKRLKRVYNFIVYLIR
jgi:hypothetical protein